MKVKALRQICSHPKLTQLIPQKETVKSTRYARLVVDTKQEEVLRIFLECLKSQPDRRAKRLFNAFSVEFDELSDEEQRAFSDPFYKELQAAQALFSSNMGNYDTTFADASCKLKDIHACLDKLAKDHYACAKKQERYVIQASHQHEGIKEGLARFQKLNDTSYPHSVVQLDNSPKMVIIGTPRLDRDNTLNRFFSVMIEEEVDVIVALNTAGDWEWAIPYHEQEHIETVELKGYSISCERQQILYEGSIVANMPKEVEELLDEMPERRRDELLKQYRPRIIERDFIVRETKTKKERKITQLHYENWPDRQAAPDLEGWWILLRRQLELQKGSIAIHCQGGIGRTNAHAILTALVSEITAQKESKRDLGNMTINVPLTMFRLKEQAPRLGGLVVPKRFWQIYAMVERYYLEIEQKSPSD